MGDAMSKTMEEIRELRTEMRNMSPAYNSMGSTVDLPSPPTGQQPGAHARLKMSDYNGVQEDVLQKDGTIRWQEGRQSQLGGVSDQVHPDLGEVVRRRVADPVVREAEDDELKTILAQKYSPTEISAATAALKSLDSTTGGGMNSLLQSEETPRESVDEL